MKKEFVILKHMPVISIPITGDSVCAGDDCDAPHEETVSLPSFLNPADFFRELLVRYSLSQISGDSAIWTCYLNGRKIAVLAQPWSSPKFMVSEMEFLKDNKMHF